jgi:hypothetical protein
MSDIGKIFGDSISAGIIIGATTTLIFASGALTNAVINDLPKKEPAAILAVVGIISGIIYNIYTNNSR